MFSKKVFSFLIGFYLLFVNSTTLTHHHSDGQHHLDCQVCVLELNQQSDDPSNLGLSYSLEPQSYAKDLNLDSFVYPVEINHQTLPRSPPPVNLTV